MNELSIIQKVYDLIKWYVPILTHLPRQHKFTLGDRTINQLYDILEGLIQLTSCTSCFGRLEAYPTN